MKKQGPKPVYGELWRLSGNRRVGVIRISNGDYWLRYKRLAGWKDIKTTDVKLSAEAARLTAWLIVEVGIKTDKRVEE